MRTVKYLYLLSIAVLLIVQYATYTALPQMVASHFSANMMANCFVPKAQYFKSLLSTSALMNAVFLLSIIILPRFPSGLINVPNKDFWMRQENRPVLNSILTSRLFGLLTGINLIFTVLSYYVYKANMSAAKMLSWHFHVVMVAFLVFVVGGMVQMMARLRKKNTPLER
ncbi:MAG TPA: hypothetical protein VLX68_16355 [Chitinivibrionales bacterium]|nr:hypothetical protein [Chitinivibrionales bacterium]